ncbi:restriction endonuclease subunit S [Meridianimaribacter flavus]|uniref:Type I restriction enzyme S subunit n=1 Tax=Meridianimaribacter flavus TaxID=571115 RepID=A0ABY2G560_9FLAO|nr:restriction endonuclease subunit S [Meridianimaribacter flavus]TDY11955.1 type I restriction enzyme S subunit [Meridianimaribacter flavus]
MREGWSEVRLIEVTSKIGSGVTPRGGSSVYVEKGIPIFRSQNIYNGEFSTSGLAYINDTIASKMKNVEVVEDDVLLNITGDSVARCCIPPREFIPGRVNQHVSIIRPRKEKLNPRYLMYSLISPRMQATLLAFASGAGATRNALTKSVLENTKINLPPLKTQRKIASILSAYDDLIENNLKRIKLLEEQAQLTYEEWFVRFKFPGHETTKFDEDTGLPEGWEKVKASDLFDIQGGTQPPKSSWLDVQKDGYVRMVQIRDYYTDSHIAYVRNNSKLRRCSKEDIMIARYGASVGRICYGIEGVYNVALVKVVPYKKSHREFLRWYLKSDFFQSNLLNKTQRTAQDGFNKGTFKSLKLNKPNKVIIEKFNLYAIPLFNFIEKLKNQNQHLKEARDILLPRLMSGMIDVEKPEIGSLKYEVNDSLGMVAEEKSEY